MMNLSPAVLAGLALLALISTVASQEAGINFPCDPTADPSGPPQCNQTMHLVCLPLYNHITEGTCHCGAGTFWNPSPIDDCRAGAGQTCSTAVPDDGKPKCVQFSTCEPVNGGGGGPNEGTCTCNEPHYPLANGSYCVIGHETLCWTVLGLRGICDSNKRLMCGGPDPINRYCVCTGANVWSESRGKCLGTVETSSSCNANDDCVDHAICVRPQFGIARCHCAPGFTKTKNNTCALALGESCDPTATDESLMCNSGQYLACAAANQTCACADGRIMSPDGAGGGNCLGLAGHDCVQHAHHECAGGNYCHVETRKCFCSLSLGYIELADRTCGRLGRGGYCRVGGFNDCPSAESLECNLVSGTGYGKCECADGLSMDDTGRCYRLAGANCSSGIQNCVANAACLHGVCTCLPDSSQTSDGRCLKTYGSSCDASNPDHVCVENQGLTCDMMAPQPSCVCPVGQEWNASRQHCVALVSGVCTPSTNNCTVNAVCNPLGFCECAPGYARRDDRTCGPSHGTACHPTTAPCDKKQFLACSDTTGGSGSQCSCEFPLHQAWEARRGQCVSVLGGRCGALDEHDGRVLGCVETADCLQGADLIPRCGCNEQDGKVPDGEGKCMRKDDDNGNGPTTTTTAGPTTTTSTLRPTAEPEDEDNGTGSIRVGCIPMLLISCAVLVLGSII